MGFSRQEYWGWVPLPSPTAILGIHKNENEAHTFTAYETRFHIAKITPFPFIPHSDGRGLTHRETMQGNALNALVLYSLILPLGLRRKSAVKLGVA